MADIIRLRGSPHEQTQSLLPWYVNGTLDPEEAALVEAHIDGCADCRAELKAERALAQRIASLPIDMEHGWATMSGKLDDAPASRTGTVVPLLRRRIPVGWAIAGQLAAAALIVTVYVASPSAGPREPTYHTLGSPSVTAPGNIVVMFKTDTNEQQIRATLLQADARLVDGPAENGAYMLRVAPADRDDVVMQLRRAQDIVLAEPIDAGTPR